MKNKEKDDIKKTVVQDLEIQKNDIKYDQKKDNKKKDNTSDLIKCNLLHFLESQWQEYILKVEEKKIKFKKEKIKLQNRLGKDVEKNKKFCLEKIIFSFLPIVDNIERALSLLKIRQEENYLVITEKLNVVLLLFQKIFAEYNIKKINDINVLFNPLIHEAVSVNYNNEMPSNLVTTIMQSGYIFHDSRLLRPAMVVVSQKKY